MSDMERNKGVLVPCTKEEILAKYPECDFDDLQYDTNYEYTKIKGHFFRLHWEVQGDTASEGFCDLHQDGRGLIHFHSYHYNGAGSLEELLEYNMSAVTLDNEEIKEENVDGN